MRRPLKLSLDSAFRVWDSTGVYPVETGLRLLGAACSDNTTLHTTDCTINAAPLTLTLTGIGTAQTVGLTLNNTTAATTGAQQYSPLLEMLGKRYTGSASQVVGWGLQAVSPSNGADAGYIAVYSNTAGTRKQMLTFGQDPTFGSPYETLALVDATQVFNIFTGSRDGLSLTNGQIFFYIGGNAVSVLSSTRFLPNSNLGQSLGDQSVEWNGLFNGAGSSCGRKLQSGTTYATLATDCKIVMSNSAARTVTLTNANNLPAGGYYEIWDGDHTAGTASISVARSGSDTINGSASTVAVVTVNNGYSTCTSDGVSAWICNVAAGSGSTPAAMYFFTSTWMKGLAASLTSGDYSEGALFWVDQACTILGAQWFQPAGATGSVTLKLWDVTAGGAAVATKTITPTANAVNTASFATPYALSSSLVGHQFAITVRDGVNQLLYTGGVPAPLTFNPMQWGPHVFLYSFGFASGDSGALATASNYAGIDLLYTVP
jgi:hypothetical protein